MDRRAASSTALVSFASANDFIVPEPGGWSAAAAALLALGWRARS
jgi:hypothetical protein